MSGRIETEPTAGLVPVEFVWQHDRGPLPRINPGRQRKPVGRTVCVKAGWRAVPWESYGAERLMIALCEVASPVISLMTQPHALKMTIAGQKRKEVYFPDLQLIVDRRFATSVVDGVPFAEAVEWWRPDAVDKRTAVMIVEVKDDRDRRSQNADYLEKLELAKRVYEGRGWIFVTVFRNGGIERPTISTAVREIMLDHDTMVDAVDEEAVRRLVAKQSGLAFLEEIVEVLGGGPIGRAKAAALHVHRKIAIDLGDNFSPKSLTRLIEN